MLNVVRWDVLPVEMRLNINGPSNGKCFRTSWGDTKLKSFL